MTSQRDFLFLKAFALRVETSAGTEAIFPFPVYCVSALPTTTKSKFSNPISIILS